MVGQGGYILKQRIFQENFPLQFLLPAEKGAKIHFQEQPDAVFLEGGHKFQFFDPLPHEIGREKFELLHIPVKGAGIVFLPESEAPQGLQDAVQPLGRKNANGIPVRMVDPVGDIEAGDKIVPDRVPRNQEVVRQGKGEGKHLFFRRSDAKGSMEGGAVDGVGEHLLLHPDAQDQVHVDFVDPLFDGSPFNQDLPLHRVSQRVLILVQDKIDCGGADAQLGQDSLEHVHPPSIFAANSIINSAKPPCIVPFDTG